MTGKGYSHTVQKQQEFACVRQGYVNFTNWKLEQLIFLQSNILQIPEIIVVY